MINNIIAELSEKATDAEQKAKLYRDSIAILSAATAKDIEDAQDGIKGETYDAIRVALYGRPKINRN